MAKKAAKRKAAPKRSRKRPAKRSAAKAPAPKAGPLDNVPPAPSHLGEFGQQYWERIAPLLVKAKILTPLHLETFEALCNQWDRYCVLSKWMRDHPDDLTFTTDKGYEAEAPQVRLQQQAFAAFTRLAPKFGLTPESLAKMGKHGGAKGNQLNSIEAFARSKYE